MSVCQTAEKPTAIHRQNSVRKPMAPIIWDYVKCFHCNGRSPFAPPPSSRQCSHNLHGLSSNWKPSNPRHPSIGYRKNGAESFGICQWLQSINCFFSAEKYSGSLFTSLTAHSSIPGGRKCFTHFANSNAKINQSIRKIAFSIPIFSAHTTNTLVS